MSIAAVTPNDDEIYDDPLAGVVMPTDPASACPLDDYEGREADLARDNAEVYALLHGDEDVPSDWQTATLRVLRNVLEQADSRLADLGSAGGDHYWQGAAEAKALAQGGMSFDAIAESVGVRPERIARLFTNRLERVGKVLAAERHVRSGSWDGDIKSVVLMSDLPRATAQLFLANIGVETNVTKSRKRGGGRKYTPEQYEAIRLYRCEYGWSWKQIEKHVGIKDSTCIKIAQRKGWM